MSIRTGVIVTVTFQQVDRTPDTKTSTECHDESLQYTDCAVEKCHMKASFDVSLYGNDRVYRCCSDWFCLNSRSDGRPLLIFLCLSRLWAHVTFLSDNMADLSAM